MRTNDTINTGRGSLVQVFESFQHLDGSISHEWMWYFIPRDGESRAIGTIDAMSAEQAIAAVLLRHGAAK